MRTLRSDELPIARSAEKDRGNGPAARIRLSIVAAAMACGPVSASGYCAAPSEPYCIRAYGTFDDRFSFESCRGQLESYQSDVEQFNDCKQDEIEEASREASDAVEEFNDAIAYWNCKAGGAVIC